MTDRQTIHFQLNGKGVEIAVKPHETLVEALRREFQLYSVRESCGQGLCGCCTVFVNGRTVSGCLYLAALVEGCDVETLEGFGDLDALSPVQQAFVDCDAFQCGFCTPGMVLMATELLAQNSNPTDDEIKQWLSGNLCRCATYPEIIDAVHRAALLNKQRLMQPT